MVVNKVIPVEEGDDYLADFKPGPLDIYRNQATFDWKLMKLALDEERVLHFKHRLWKTLELDPLFAHSSTELTMEEMRHITALRVQRIIEYNFLPEDMPDPTLFMALNQALGQYDWSVSVKRSLQVDFFRNAIRGAGTARHGEFIDSIGLNQVTGCFCLTEISHGTDTRSMKTKAVYVPNKRAFILQTPDFEAAKAWVGVLGKTATDAVVFCQLYTPDGICHGLHSFIVPIRDRKTLLPFPGVTIGDMGEKLGLNGLDNGYILFDNYEIPRENLLNKNGDVDVDGKYVTPFKDPNKRFGASLGNLSAGRVGIIMMACSNLFKAIPIAVRYSAVRRQFGTNGQEFPVLEYQMQQWRILPYLCGAYALKIFGDMFFNDYVEFVVSQMSGEDKDRLALLGAEIHAISSAGKPFATWLARDAAQECREACGGHGYLRSSGLGAIRNDNEANCTYEGDNNVLMEQTSNWLISCWAKSGENKTVLGSLDFLGNAKSILNGKFRPKTVGDLYDMNVVLDAYKWLICFLLQSTSEKFHSSVQSGKDIFTARNDSQVYQARTLSLVYIQHFILLRFGQFINKPDLNPDIRQVLQKLYHLFGYWMLEKHLQHLYQGGYIHGKNPTDIIHEVILELCSNLKSDAVALCDVISPPDFVLNSVLGRSDGQLYKNLKQAFSQVPGGLERATFWKEIVNDIRPKL